MTAYSISNCIVPAHDGDETPMTHASWTRRRLGDIGESGFAAIVVSTNAVGIFLFWTEAGARESSHIRSDSSDLPERFALGRALDRKPGLADRIVDPFQNDARARKRIRGEHRGSGRQ